MVARVTWKIGNSISQRALPIGERPIILASQRLGEIGIQIVDSLEGMVLQVITLERYGTGQQVRRVGKNAGQRIHVGLLEKIRLCEHSWIITHRGVARERTHEKRRRDNQPPRRPADQPSHAQLDRDSEQDDEERVGILADQVAHFGMVAE